MRPSSLILVLGILLFLSCCSCYVCKYSFIWLCPVLTVARTLLCHMGTGSLTRVAPGPCTGSADTMGPPGKSLLELSAGKHLQLDSQEPQMYVKFSQNYCWRRKILFPGPQFPFGLLPKKLICLKSYLTSSSAHLPIHNNFSQRRREGIKSYCRFVHLHPCSEM